MSPVGSSKGIVNVGIGNRSKTLGKRFDILFFVLMNPKENDKRNSLEIEYFWEKILFDDDSCSSYLSESKILENQNRTTSLGECSNSFLHRVADAVVDKSDVGAGEFFQSRNDMLQG